jgi:hypothetical protein
MLTGWPTLPKPSFINQRFGWLIMLKPSIIKPRFGGWTITTTASTTSLSNQSNHDHGGSEKKIQKIWEVGVGQRRRDPMLSVQNKAID